MKDRKNHFSTEMGEREGPWLRKIAPMARGSLESRNLRSKLSPRPVFLRAAFLLILGEARK